MTEPYKYHIVYYTDTFHSRIIELDNKITTETDVDELEAELGEKDNPFVVIINWVLLNEN